MFCTKCGAQMGEGYAFCPNCGAPNTTASAVSAAAQPSPAEETPVSPSPTVKLPEEAPAAEEMKAPEPVPDMPMKEDPQTVLADEAEDVTTRLDDHSPWQMNSGDYAAAQPPTSPRMPADYYGVNDNQATMMAYDDEPWSAPRYETPNYPGNNYGMPAYQPQQPMQYEQPKANKREKQPKVYPKISGGKKALSVFLCLLIFLFGTLAIIITGARIGLTEDHVREACQEGTLADMVITTDKGEQTLTDIVYENVQKQKNDKIANLERAKVRQILTGISVKTFVEDVAVDYQRYIFDGTIPVKLNADSIGNFLRSLNDEIKRETGFWMTEEYITDIQNNINGGNLSYLSIDSAGGAMKTKYGFDPHWITIAFSLAMMIILLVVTVLFVILIFVINGKNPPTSLRFNGAALLIPGALFTITAIAGLIFALVKNIYFVSVLIKYLSIGIGIPALAMLVIGILFLVIAGIMKKKSAKAA